MVLFSCVLLLEKKSSDFCLGQKNQPRLSFMINAGCFCDQMKRLNIYFSVGLLVRIGVLSHCFDRSVVYPWDVQLQFGQRVAMSAARKGKGEKK